MQAIEFETKINNGTIRLPAEFDQWVVWLCKAT